MADGGSADGRRRASISATARLTAALAAASTSTDDAGAEEGRPPTSTRIPSCSRPRRTSKPQRRVQGDPLPLGVGHHGLVAGQGQADVEVTAGEWTRAHGIPIIVP